MDDGISASSVGDTPREPVEGRALEEAYAANRRNLGSTSNHGNLKKNKQLGKTFWRKLDNREDWVLT